MEEFFWAWLIVVNGARYRKHGRSPQNGEEVKTAMTMKSGNSTLSILSQGVLGCRQQRRWTLFHIEYEQQPPFKICGRNTNQVYRCRKPRGWFYRYDRTKKNVKFVYPNSFYCVYKHVQKVHIRRYAKWCPVYLVSEWLEVVEWHGGNTTVFWREKGWWETVYQPY